MFNKSKRKIVFAITVSLLVLMLVTLTTIYVSNLLTTRRETEEMLKTYVDQYDVNKQPNEPKEGANERPVGPVPPDAKDEERRNEPSFRLSTFYSVAYSDSGEVLSINSGNNDMQSEESLLEIASSILGKNKESGKLDNLYYRVAQKDGYTLVAMIDGTINDKNQKSLFWQMLAIGGAALIVLFIISIFIANKIVRPIEENDKKQKRFVSDAGHELKTPIAVISANSELLRREIGENEWLANIDYENEKMSELVKQLLALSRAENGTAAKERLDLSQLVTGEVLPFESLVYEKNKRIESEIEPYLIINGNANQLRQLVSILLDNALSHGVGEEIKLSLKSGKHSVRLAVSNGAKEMSDEQLSHLFDRFYRTDEARKEGDSHYGLGLSIAKAVVDAHGGDIKVDYANGQLVFAVVFPK